LDEPHKKVKPMQKLLNPQFYTQIPNKILDSQPDLSLCDFCIVIALCRETFGWHRPEIKLTHADLCKKTGLSMSGVTRGLNNLVNLGIVVKLSSPTGNTYSVPIENETPEPDQSEQGGLFPSTIPLVPSTKGVCSLVLNPNKGKKVLKETKVLSNPIHMFVEAWSQEFPKHHDGQPYLTTQGRDHAAAKQLLAHISSEKLMDTAIAAWGNPDSFWCKRAVTIHGFYNSFNDICEELRSFKRPAKPTTSKAETPIWKQIQIIELTLEEHPANRSFRGYSKEKCTDEMREQYKQLKAKRDALRQQELQNTTSLDL
jgi:phage replication O-like protein O